MLGEGDMFGNNGSFCAQEKRFGITFQTRFYLNLHYNHDNSHFLVIANGKRLIKFKASEKNVNFPNKSYLGIISKKFEYGEAEKVSSEGNVYNFLVDYDAVTILHIQKCLIIKKKIK